jgi:hypothetical protein
MVCTVASVGRLVVDTRFVVVEEECKLDVALMNCFV